MVCSSYTSGILDVRVGTNAVSSLIDGVGTYTFYIKEGGYPYINFFTGIGFNGSIESVSVREVGQDWTLGTGWSIGEDKANCDGTQTSNSSLSQNSALPNASGKTYKISFTVSNYISGSVQVYPTNTTVGTYIKETANGTYTRYVKVTSLTPNDILYIQADSNFIGSITNISVKEVGQNWNLGTGWSIGEDKVIATSMSNQFVTQSFTFTSGKRYRASFSVTGTSSLPNNASLRLPYDGDVSNIAYVNQNSDGVYSHEFISNGSSTLYLGYGSFTGTITNISVIQITTDTNLPRINYEGFSYQDALGSELVTNGGFDDGLNGWSPHAGSTLELENGMAKVTTAGGSGFIKRTDLSIETGKTYFCKAYITNGLSPQWFINSVNNPINLSLISENTYGGYVTTNGNNPFFYIRGNNTDGEVSYIDNVSVKEYLGQEVVPDSGCGSWLWEPQTTQLLSYSEDFSQYSNVGAITLTGGLSSPDGGNNAYKVEGVIGSTVLYLPSALTTNSTRSIYARTVSGTGTAQLLSHTSNTNNLFNITEDWQRFDVNLSSGSGVSSFYGIDFRGSGTLSEIILWGANATNDQDYATSYIPSNGSTVTRNQDVCNNGGSLASINSEEGVIYWEGAKLQEASGTQVIGLSDGSGVNRIGFQTSATANQIRFVVDAGGNQASKFFVLDDITDFNKLALKWKQDDFSFWVNGIKIGTDTSGNVPPLNALNTLDFYYGTGIFNFFCKTKALAVWKEALSDSELQSLTTI